MGELYLGLLLLIAAGCSGSAGPPTAVETAIPTSLPTPTATSTPTPALTATPTRTRAPTSTVRPTSTPTPTKTWRQVLAERYPELAEILNNPEIDKVYKDLLGAYRQGGLEAAMDLARQHGLITPEGDIRTTLILDTEDTASTVAQLRSLGVKVVGTSGNHVDVAFAPEELMSGGTNVGQLLTQFSSLQHVTGVVPEW